MQTQRVLESMLEAPNHCGEQLVVCLGQTPDILSKGSPRPRVFGIQFYMISGADWGTLLGGCSGTMLIGSTLFRRRWAEKLTTSMVTHFRLQQAPKAKVFGGLPP